MSVIPRTEVWLSGQLPGIIPPLQPVAHALLQVKEEVQRLMADFPDTLLFKNLHGLASPAFHLQHMAGVLDRLFTYARAQQLSPRQLEGLQQEGKPAETTTAVLLNAFLRAVDTALDELGEMTAEQLYDQREVGRSRLPSTRFGLLVHSAEHTMRHLGQLLVTVRVLLAEAPQG